VKNEKSLIEIVIVLLLFCSSMGCARTNVWKDLNKNGQMEPYETPKLTIEERVDDLLSRMTLEEKIQQLSGDPKTDLFTGYYNARLGIPRIKCSDGPHGVRWGNATFFPVPIAFGSTWDPELIEEIGSAMGEEFRAKGRNMGLAPCMNLIRDPRGGRVFETYSEDPYLVSKLAVAFIKGVQSKRVIATPKHFVCNNQEDVRQREDAVHIDERTLLELYLPPFKAAIKEGGAWSIMGAYNGINDVYCCYNKHLLKDILKDEWEFKGFVVSDWGGCHGTVKSANAGLDLEMPIANYYGPPLLEAVKNGSVSESTIDESVRRILRAKFWAGLFEKEPKVDRSKIESKEHIDLALKAARESIVLLKNDKFLLPLDASKIRSIAVIGPNADADFRSEGGSSAVASLYAVSILEGIKNKVGNRIEVKYAKGCEIGEEHKASSPSEVKNEALFSKAIKLAKKSDVVIVVVGLSGKIESEGKDRKCLNLPGIQDELVKEAFLANNNTIIVLMNGSPVTSAGRFYGIPLLYFAPAILEVWYPGQEGGTAVADALFGDYNPGGKLPATFPAFQEQLPPWNDDYTKDYTEGRGYRYFDKQGIEPMFSFGYGLSYTDFEYSNLKIMPEESADGNVSVSVDVKNVGDMKGDEVVQLYIHDAERSTGDQPIKELKGFKRITLKPGVKKAVNFKLEAEDLAFYDKDLNYLVEPGKIDVMVGSSSRDIRLTSSFKITKEIRR